MFLERCLCYLSTEINKQDGSVPKLTEKVIGSQAEGSLSGFYHYRLNLFKLVLL